MSDRPPLPPSVSGCTIESEIRSGPAEVVARAKDGLGLPLDIHFFLGEAILPHVSKEVFFDQVRATAALHHERLAAVVNAGEKGAWWFVACKGTEGATLAHLFARGHLDEERALGIFAAVAEGLVVLEGAGLRHGGLDPQTVALPGAGQTLLGLRRLAPSALAARNPAYVAPEEARGEDWGISSDLFSLGLMLFESLHGKPALEGTPDEIRAKLERGNVPAPGLILKGVLPQTVDLVASLLSTDPRGRPASATEVVRRLRMLQGAFSATETLEGALDLSGAALMAAPAAPAAPASAAVAFAPAARTRRAHARLVLPRRDWEALHEILDDVTWVGPDEHGVVVAGSAQFPGAIARVECGAQSDEVVATGELPLPRMKGRDIQREVLRFGDEFEVAGKRILFEKAEKLLPEGAEGTEAAEGAEPKRSHRIRKKSSKAPVYAGVALCAAALGWGILRWTSAAGARGDEIQAAKGRQLSLEGKYSALPPATAQPSAAERASREEAAFRQLDLARAEAERGGRKALERYETLVKQFPDSGAALVARDEMATLKGNPGTSLADELRATQAKAEALAAEGKVAEAQEVLLKFSGSHPGSFLGDRANLAASTLARIASDHVDDLVQHARLAADRKDWQTALDDVNRALAMQAPPDVLDRARQAQFDIRKRMPRTSLDGPAGDAPPSGPTPPDGKRPPTEAKGPKPPGEGPRPAEKKPAELEGKDEEAARLFKEAREALDANRPGDCERTLYRLITEYPESKILREYGDEARQRYADALKKGRGVAGLFHGGVQFKGNRVVLTYGFDRPGEAEDWETVHLFAVPNKGTFRVEGGELSAQGAGAFMLRGCFRTESVSMSFKIRPGSPPQDIGAMLAEPKDVLNNIYFTLNNDFFKLGKGAAAYAAPGNVIFVFGKGMWRDTDPGMVGFVRTASSEEPKVEAYKWTEVTVAKEKDKARFTVGGKPLVGRAIGDNKYEITGVRPALFTLLSIASFDEVVIEGDLDPEWAKAERDRLFPALR
jgi:hypothetical protein